MLRIGIVLNVATYEDVLDISLISFNDQDLRLAVLSMSFVKVMVTSISSAYLFNADCEIHNNKSPETHGESAAPRIGICLGWTGEFLVCLEIEYARVHQSLVERHRSDGLSLRRKNKSQQN